MSQLVTGEAVVLDLSTAGVPSRFVAAIIDAIAQFVIFLSLMMLIAAVTSDASEALVAALFLIAYVLAGAVYPVLLETILSGRTPGKMALGLRVVRDDGGPIGFRQAITRGLIGFFIEKPGLTWGAAGLITALINRDGKRLGDLAAGTVVVQERTTGRRIEHLPVPPAYQGWATTLDVSAMSDDLASSAMSYLSRYGALTAAADAELGGRLASAVAAVVTPPPPPGIDARTYLYVVMAERRRRAALAHGYAVTVAPAVPSSLAGYAASPAPPPPVAPPLAPSPSTPEPPASPFAPPM